VSRKRFEIIIPPRIPAKGVTAIVCELNLKLTNNLNNDLKVRILIFILKVIMMIIQFNSIQFIYVQNLTATGQLQS
jgi:hypothetical protein